MSTASNNQGRAYEFVCLKSLHDAIAAIRPAEIVRNSSYSAAEKAWDTLSSAEQALYTLSAKSTIDTIFALEPNLTEKGEDTLRLYIQTDLKGQGADVRDILIERDGIAWQIGLSIKHNHMAVKHSRIAESLDFGEKWYKVPCSEEYWDEVKPVFAFLEEEKDKQTYFRDLAEKDKRIYLPLLNAFTKEISKQVGKDKEIPRRLIEYLLSKYDFYKVISLDGKRVTTIQSFNMYGTLNLPSRTEKPKIKTPVIKLPANLFYIGLKPESKTTVIMCFDNGWQFSFRIHNARDVVEPSLKFDIQVVGMPADLNIKYYCKWEAPAAN